MPTLSSFDAATSFDPLGGGRYAGAVHDGWDIVGNANGGYVLALAAAAMRTETGRADPLSVTAHYLRPIPAGPVEVDVEVVKRGRQLATAVATMRRGDTDLLRLIGAFGAAPTEATPSDRLDGGPPRLPAYDDAPRRGSTPDGPSFDTGLMGRLAVRLHPDDAGFQRGEPSGEALMRGWFAFADGRPVDTLALLLAADAFPPALFNLGDRAPGWVPTVELTVHVRGVPAPGPLACAFRTRFVTGGWLEEDGEVWDSSGRLVALSRQLALAPR